jgi:hypothetical protein
MISMARLFAASVIVIGGASVGCAPLYAPTSSAPLGPASLDPGSVQAAAVGCWQLDWDVPPDLESLVGGELPDSVGFGDAPLFDGRGWVLSPETQPEGRGFGAGPPPGGVPWEQRFRANRWTVNGQLVEIIFSEEPSSYWSLMLRLEEGILGGVADYFEASGPGEGLRGIGIRAEPISCLTDA